MIQQARVFQPQFVRAQQQLGEIDQPAAVAVVLVELVDPHPGGRDRVVQVLDVARALALVLARVDKPLRLARGPVGLVHALVADDAAQQALLVFRVQDLEFLR